VATSGINAIDGGHPDLSGRPFEVRWEKSAEASVVLYSRITPARRRASPDHKKQSFID
jgi:hypothetical protein